MEAFGAVYSVGEVYLRRVFEWSITVTVMLSALDMIVHEVAHIVEGGSKNTQRSPQFGIWGDSKWAEIFIYDVYR